MEVGEDFHQQLFSLVKENPTLEITVDLEDQRVVLPDGQAAAFPIDPFSKKCLLQGIDQLSYLLQHEARTAAYEQANG